MEKTKNKSIQHNLTLKDCLNMPFEQSFEIIKKQLGEEKFNKALNIKNLYPSKIEEKKDTKWCQTIKIIGINPRITKTYWNTLIYALSFHEEGIHLMPLFESGDGSIYVQNSWKLNNDFLDENLIKLGYETAEKQLKLIINIMHCAGKIVGFDALPHVDNFSEIVLLNPNLFEWIKLSEDKTRQLSTDEIDYNQISKEVQEIIIKELNLNENIFDENELLREDVIFPQNKNSFEIRMKLRKDIREKGIEPIPVTEHIPLRPILFDKIETSDNENWAKFYVPNQDNTSIIIGSNTPYKFYEIDRNGYPIKNKINNQVWNYIINKFKTFQSDFNFDFLRADMAHCQLSHAHNEEAKDFETIEFWKQLKKEIQANKPYFGTFAEAFYGNYYIDGISDMINKNFDIVLGDMNYKLLDENYINYIDDFLNPFREHIPFYPCISIFTNDSDIEENNKYYASNEENLLRVFFGLFLNLPSYMGMGFETRDINPKKENNYTNKYVKKQKEEYLIGDNKYFFYKFKELEKIYNELKPIINNFPLKQLYDEDNKLSLNWSYKKNNEEYLFIANLNKNSDQIKIKTDKDIEKIIFSTNKINSNKNEKYIQFKYLHIYDFAIIKLA